MAAKRSRTSNDPALLVDVAGRVFGTQLPKRSMTRVAPVLLERWLPHARDDTLTRLTNITQTALGKAYAGQVYATRESQVDFLQARKKTNNFLENLRDAFHREHRASWLIPKAGAGEDARGVYDLRGQGGDPLYAPYPHTLQAQRTLDELKRAGPVRGLVVLPTGAGKTDVAVGWLLQQLQRDPQLRVLWLAHQISLLDQSAVRFERAAHQLPAGFDAHAADLRRRPRADQPPRPPPHPRRLRDDPDDLAQARPAQPPPHRGLELPRRARRS